MWAEGSPGEAAQDAAGCDRTWNRAKETERFSGPGLEGLRCWVTEMRRQEEGQTTRQPVLNEDTHTLTHACSDTQGSAHLLSSSHNTKQGEED